MEEKDFNTKWHEFTSSIQKQMWQFEKDNNCLIERFNIRRRIDYGVTPNTVIHTVKAEIDYEE